MWIQAGALAPTPGYAVVDKDAVARVLRRLTADDELTPRLEAAFRVLEAEQPALASFLGEELSELENQAAQALSYFLFLVAFLSFREAFGPRLARVTHEDVEIALDHLVADSEVRDRTGCAGSYSQDVVAAAQPALMSLVMGELDMAPEGSGDLDPLLQALLVQIVALTRCVSPLT
jgi:hypothetical protein